MKKTLLGILVLILVIFGIVSTTLSQANTKIGGGGRRNQAKNPQVTAKPSFNRTNTVYTYSKNGIYRIYCQEHRLTDIQLQNGETILFIGAGDTVNWQVDKDISGNGDSQQAHIYVKPLRSGISTNLIINTDRHSYHCEIIAGTAFSPIVSWNYPNEKKRSDSFTRPAGPNDLNIGSGDINFNYRVSGLPYPWKPKMVFSDKTHVYIKMPAEMKSDEAPVLFIKDGRKLQLVNYRVRNGYYIVDRLFEKAELRCGNRKVRITRTKNQTGKAN